jgi:hypothetical protein
MVCHIDPYPTSSFGTGDSPFPQLSQRVVAQSANGGSAARFPKQEPNGDKDPPRRGTPFKKITPASHAEEDLLEPDYDKAPDFFWAGGPEVGMPWTKVAKTFATRELPARTSAEVSPKKPQYTPFLSQATKEKIRAATWGLPSPPLPQGTKPSKKKSPALRGCIGAA